MTTHDNIDNPDDHDGRHPRFFMGSMFSVVVMEERLRLCINVPSASVVYDICHGGLKHDITSVEGFETLMLLALRLLPFAIGGAWAHHAQCLSTCLSSQHLRHLFGPLGHPRDVATQLGNRIANIPCLEMCFCL